MYDGHANFDFPLVTWEVIQARLAGQPMDYFNFQHWGFPDRYEVVLILSRSFLKDDPGLAARFVEASAQGFTYAAHHPGAAAKILIDDNPGVFSVPALVYDSAAMMAKSFWLDPQGKFGYQDYAKWYGYTRFVVGAGSFITPKVLRSPRSQPILPAGLPMLTSSTARASSPAVELRAFPGGPWPGPGSASLWFFATATCGSGGGARAMAVVRNHHPRAASDPANTLVGH